MIGTLSEPNWLLSTTVQASAALVGIVGGLLISRLVSLSAERSALERQVEAALDDRRRTAQVLDERHADRLVSAMVDFSEQALQPIADAIERRSIDLDEILSAHHTRGTDVKELHPFATQFVERVRSASVELNSMFNPNDVPATLSELKKQGVRFPKEDAEIYQAVLTAIGRRRPASARFAADAALAAIRGTDTARVVRDLEVRDALVSAERLARQEHDAAVARHDLAERALTLKGEPAQLGEALTVLIAFALMGIVYPSIILAVGPASLGWEWRLSVVGFFLLGLALLLGYLVRSVQTLTPRVDATQARATERGGR